MSSSQTLKSSFVLRHTSNELQCCANCKYLFSAAQASNCRQPRVKLRKRRLRPKLGQLATIAANLRQLHAGEASPELASRRATSERPVDERATKNAATARHASFISSARTPENFRQTQTEFARLGFWLRQISDEFEQCLRRTKAAS